MIKSISFIVLTHLFQFNQLKILRQPGNIPSSYTFGEHAFRVVWNWKYIGTYKCYSVDCY